MARTVLLVVFLSILVCCVEGQWDWQDERGYGPQWDPPYCPPDSQWSCWQPPFWPFDPIRVRIPEQGEVVGRSMAYAPYKYVNWFLGVPYAKPPITELRFKRPVPRGQPGWDEDQREWWADHYRPACPQEIWELDQDFYNVRNTSEDCLYLNIFRPNLTYLSEEQNKDYPVMVFVHGEDYKTGDAQLYPGHILAKKEMMVITFNYRLGALGFLSTLDKNSPGNYGLWDVIEVLKFIQRDIDHFGGNPNKVTLVGQGSGAAMVGILLMSEQYLESGYRPLFHNVIMMSGSEMCEWATVQPMWASNAREYAKDLGRLVGCDPDYGLPIDHLVECLRYKHFEEIVNASASTPKKYGALSGPFGPVVDGSIGGMELKDIILSDTPQNLRKNGKFPKIKVIIGINRHEGAYLAENMTQDILGLRMEEGMDPGTFRDLLYQMVRKRSLIRNVHEVVGAMEFEYTFWAKPDNKTAVRENFVDLWSDMMYGWCVDATIKSHAAFETPVYMYLFDHRSDFEVLPRWMGIPHGKDVEYLFGYPFFNETLGNITGITPNQWDWTVIDKNISAFMQDMWANFTKYGNPTTEWTRNVSWFPFSLYNLSHLHISEHSWMDINLRQNHYAFWREYFPVMSDWWPITTTPGPTPRPMVEYQAATWALTGAAIITLCLIGALGITLWRRTRSDTPLLHWQ